MLLDLSSADIKRIFEKKKNEEVIKELIYPSNEEKDILEKENAKQLLKSIIRYVGDFDQKRKQVDLENSVSDENVFHLIGVPGNLNYHYLRGRVATKFNTNVGITIDHPYCFKQGLIVIVPPDNLLNNKDVTKYGINEDFIVLHLHDHLRNTRNETFLILRRKDFLLVKDSFKLSCGYDIVTFKATLSCIFEVA